MEIVEIFAQQKSNITRSHEWNDFIATVHHVQEAETIYNRKNRIYTTSAHIPSSLLSTKICDRNFVQWHYNVIFFENHKFSYQPFFAKPSVESNLQYRQIKYGICF